MVFVVEQVAACLWKLYLIHARGSILRANGGDAFGRGGGGGGGRVAVNWTQGTLTDLSAHVVAFRPALVASRLTGRWGQFGFHHITNLHFSRGANWLGYAAPLPSSAKTQQYELRREAILCFDQPSETPGKRFFLPHSLKSKV